MASTSLGTLTLDLAVRLSEFTDGLSRAERETRDSTENMGASVGKFKEKLMDDLSGTAVGDAIGSLNEKLSSITEAFGEGGLAGAAKIGAASVIGSVVAIGAGLIALAVETAEADRQLVLLADKANTTTRNLQVLAAAAGNFGLDMEGVTDVLADAREKFGEFSATGGGGLVDTLELLQKSTKMTDAEIAKFGREITTVDTVDAITMVENALADANVTTQEARFVNESLASGLDDIAPIWSNNAEILKQVDAQLEQTGVIRTQESIDQSAILSQQIQDTTVQFNGLKNQLVTATLPAISGLIDYMSGSTDGSKDLGSNLSVVGSIAKGVASFIIGLSAAFKTVAYTIAGASMALFSFYDLSGKMLTSPLDAIEHFAEFRRTVDNAITFTKQDIHDAWMAGGTAINKIYDPQVGDLVTGAGNDVRSSYTPPATTDSSGRSAASKENTTAVKENTKSRDINTKSLKELGSAYVSNTALSGLKLKANEAIAGGKARGYTAEFAEVTQSLLGDNLKYFSAINDTYHAGSDSKHATGQAFDVVLNDAKKAKNAVAEIKAAAKEYGYQIKILDEYANPSKNATGGHLHVSVYGQKDNGKGGADLAWIKQQNSAATAEVQKEAAEAERALQDMLRRQGSITAKYATEREKIESEHLANVTEIKALYAEGSAKRDDLLAREEVEYIDAKNAKAKSILAQYLTGEAKLKYEHGLKLKAIDDANVEDDSARQALVDEQNKAYQKDLENFKFAAEAKLREQDKLYQAIADSARASSMNALSTGKDSMMQRTLGGEEYQAWRLNQDYVEGFDSINNQYKSRESEITDTDERGDPLLPMLEQFELLEIAKQEHLDNMWAMEQEYALKDKALAEQIQNAKLNSYASNLGAMGTLLGVFAGENNRVSQMMFAAQKGYALAQIYLNNKVAISEAWASAPFPYNAGAVAMALIETGALVSAAQAITPAFSGIAHGGLDYVPKESTYLLDKGERVLSPRQNTDLTDFMGKKDSSSNNSEVNITVNVDAKGNTQVSGDNDRMGRDMANGIKAVVMDTLRKEKRQGGMLYA